MSLFLLSTAYSFSSPCSPPIPLRTILFLLLLFLLLFLNLPFQLILSPSNIHLPPHLFLSSFSFSSPPSPFPLLLLLFLFFIYVKTGRDASREAVISQTDARLTGS